MTGMPDSCLTSIETSQMVSDVMDAIQCEYHPACFNRC